MTSAVQDEQSVSFNPIDRIHREVLASLASSAFLRGDPELSALIERALATKTPVSIALDNPNVVIARTFSKAYGMAGIRLGYAVGHADTIKKMREWDGGAGSWIDRTPSSIPAAWPSARANHAAAWDAARSRMVMFGGAPDSPLELWEWDGSAWSQRVPASGAQPEARAAHAMVWDAARRVTVSFGGCCSLDELWEWDGDRWSLRN